MGGETASALPSPPLTEGQSGMSAGWGHIEVVLGGRVSQRQWRRVIPPSGIGGPNSNGPSGLFWAGMCPGRVSLFFVGHTHVSGWHRYQLQAFWLEGHFPVV